MDKQILAELVKLNATLDAMRQEQKAFNAKLLQTVAAGLGDVESAVSQLGGPLDEAASSLFEIQMQTMPGGDPREPAPTNGD
jgi:hypothetical protein